MSTPTSAHEQLQALAAQMEALRSRAIAELKEKKTDLQRQIDEVEREIAELSGEPKAERPQRRRRSTLTDEQITEQVKKLLAGGVAMSGREIQEHLGLSFGRFKEWLVKQSVVVNTGTGKSNSRYELAPAKK